MIHYGRMPSYSLRRDGAVSPQSARRRRTGDAHCGEGKAAPRLYAVTSI